MKSIKWVLKVLIAPFVLAIRLSLVPIALFVLLIGYPIDAGYRWGYRRYQLWRISKSLREDLRKFGWDGEALEIALQALVETVEKAIAESTAEYLERARNSDKAGCGLPVTVKLGEFEELFRKLLEEGCSQ